MSSSLSHSHNHSLFWQSPSGLALLQWEQTVLDRFAQQVFGFHALAFSLNGLQALQASAVQNQLHVMQADIVLVTTGLDALSVAHADTLTMSLSDWPIQDESLDYIVMPHVLEFVANPHALLREAARCLRPGGYITLLCFNPNSLLGLRAVSAGLGSSRRWLSRRRLIDWLELLSLHVDQGAFGQWRPTGMPSKRHEQLSWLDALGERFWPQMANVYALRVIKRSVPDVRQFNLKATRAFVKKAQAVGAARESSQDQIL